MSCPWYLSELSSSFWPELSVVGYDPIETDFGNYCMHPKFLELTTTAPPH